MSKELDPPTFADKHALVSAEIARIEGRDLEAMRLYNEAIRAARENGFVQNEGIAHEKCASEELVQFFAFVVDLSDQKRAEEALQRAQTELAHFSRVMTVGELTASIAHEINQPLASMVTNANASLRWLAGETPDLAEAREAIHRIVRDGNRASAVIARTRALIKKAPIAKEPLEINDVIQEVLALTQNELQRYQISVRTQFANDLPSVKADRIQLQQVLLNLVVNAIHAMSTVSDGPRELQLASQTIAEIDSQGAKESGPRPPSVGPRPAQVSVTIKDSGPGFDAEHLDHLFDPFFSTKPGGLGIGLTITRSIIEAHGGRVSAKANLPRGAVFEFTLPVNAAGVQPSNQSGGHSSVIDNVIDIKES